MSSVSGKRPACRVQEPRDVGLAAAREVVVRGAGAICAPGKCLKTSRPFEAFSSLSPHCTSHFVMKCCGPTNSATLTSNLSCAETLS